jgi:hypothetical protein
MNYMLLGGPPCTPAPSVCATMVIKEVRRMLPGLVVWRTTDFSSRKLTEEESADQNWKREESPTESTVDTQGNDQWDREMNRQNPRPRKLPNPGSPETEGQVYEENNHSDKPQSHKVPSRAVMPVLTP